MFTIATFYQFTALPDFAEMQAPLRDFCASHAVKGTILLAEEGLNATIAGPAAGVAAVLAHLRTDPRLAALEAKFSEAEEQPFHRLKVRLKQEIVKLGIPGIDPNDTVGTYVEPTDWNALLADPNVTVIDTRNHFEVAIGTFQGATDPETTSFGELPAYVAQELDPAQHKQVAMFCTGGIRCEKATAYLLKQGFEKVYHLRGGILKYLEEVPPEESLWEGECFVFDNRITVDHDLAPGTYAMCFACHRLLTAEDQAAATYQPGRSCPHCHDSLPEADRARAAERHRQILLAEARGETHLG